MCSVALLGRLLTIFETIVALFYFEHIDGFGERIENENLISRGIINDIDGAFDRIFSGGGEIEAEGTVVFEPCDRIACEIYDRERFVVDCDGGEGAFRRVEQHLGVESGIGLEKFGGGDGIERRCHGVACVKRVIEDCDAPEACVCGADGIFRLREC